MPYTPNSLQLDWIVNGINNDNPIKWAEEFGTFLATNEDNRGKKKLTTTQLRKFFGQLKRIQAEGYSTIKKHQLLMLKPQLAYAVGRDKQATKIDSFEKELSKAISKVAEAEEQAEGEKRFKNFVSLTEAIVAYHKAKGGE